VPLAEPEPVAVDEVPNAWPRSTRDSG